jgi:hypothetical protein
MFKRITLAAFASTAILSLAAISPASAQHHPGTGGMHLGGSGMHHPGGFGGFHPGGFHPGGFHPGGHHPGGFHPGGFHPGGFHPHHPRWWRWHWRHYPYSQVFVEPGYSTSYVAPTYTTSAPTAVATCPSNCLKKQYLEDGSVVFTDQCTNESATAPAPAGSNG